MDGALPFGVRGELEFKFHNMTEENIIDVAEVTETYAPSSLLLTIVTLQVPRLQANVERDTDD